MNPADAKVAEILVTEELIDQTQLQHLLAQQQALGGKLIELVTEAGLVQEKRVADALAAAFNIPRLRLDELPPDAGALSLLDAATCEQHTVFPVALRNQGKILWLAVSDPFDKKLQKMIGERAGVELVKPGIAGAREIRKAIMTHFGSEAFSAHDGVDVETELDDIGDFDDGESADDDADKTLIARPENMPTRSDTEPELPVQRPEETGDPPPRREPTAVTSVQLQEVLALVKELAVGHEQLMIAQRAIVELCAERGLFSVEEFRKRKRSKQ